MSESQRIPVFPLGIVLFPESRVPLHIFEDRYKKLIEQAVKEHSPFGINYVEEDRLHAVGCSARVVEVLDRRPDGEMDIITEGERRYEVLDLEQNGPDRISFATVRWLDDEPEERDSRLAGETIHLFNELTELAYKGTIPPLDESVWNAESRFPSFKIAQKSGLEAPQRQALLSVTSENERLSMLREFLTQLLPKVKEFETVQDHIRNDGYIVNWNKKPPEGDTGAAE
ncbi:MAG: LON peptidase substrate-binding domain-containing protein [Bacteroidota bacterium]|nr:LON peptidase substrate-binding domain-containing protein [Bacteroidota bacterium]